MGEKGLSRVHFWVGIIAALGGGLLFPLAGNVSQYGGMLVRVQAVEASVDNLEKKIDERLLPRHEFNTFTAQIMSAIESLRGDVRAGRGDK